MRTPPPPPTRRGLPAPLFALRRRRVFALPAALLFISLSLPHPSAAQPQAAAPRPAPTPQRITREGVAVELSVEPAARGMSAAPTAGEDVTVTFRITDAAAGTPLAGARPAAWLSLRESGDAAGDARCREKVQSFVQGSLRARPEVDLNAYYVLALNQEPNLSVIDPLLGFGGSKLVALVLLKSPGADWALTSDRTKLFVSLPAVNQVAVVDTATWKVVANVDAGPAPTRLRLRPGEKQLWVANDTDAANPQGGVTVIDITTNKASPVPTGAGAHDIAFSEDGRLAFVTNAASGTLSVVDAARPAKLKDVKAGARPVAVAYSQAARAAYVASEDGQITAVGGAGHEPRATLAAKPGLKSVRFAPGGRYGFAPNAAESVVHVFDAATNRLLHSVAVGRAPDQIAFTGAFAYVRSAGSAEVSMIRLSTLGKEPDVVKFPGGQAAPNAEPSFAAAGDSVAVAPEGNAVLVANAADKQIYYYAEGMAAPMGSFQNYRRVPRAVRVVDRSLREVARGTYATTVKIPKAGSYDVAFLLDSPRVVNCFDLAVAANPALREERKAALRIEYLNESKQLRADEPYKLRFRLLDAAGKPAEGLTDVRVLFFLSPGVWQKRDFARHAGGGVYELTLTAPREGVYMVFVESQSQGVGFRQLPYLTLQVANSQPAK